MEASSGWIPVVLAFIAAFGGAPLFKFLAERVRGNVALSESNRADFEKEKAEFRKDRDTFWDEQRRDAASTRLENKTMRDAYNDLSTRNGWLDGQLARCNEHVTDLENEVRLLRNSRGYKQAGTVE